MENSILGIALTVITPFGVLGLASGARKLGLGIEGSRKLVHILLCNWILLALAVYQNAWSACILPALFIPMNYLSYRKGIFSAIERGADNTPGTVWYAVSLFLLCLFGYSIKMPWIAACGILAMGYGDGFGALVGKYWGKLRFPAAHSKKSLEGMFTVMLFTGLAVWFVCTAYAPEYMPNFALCAALSCAVPSAVIELFSPRGTDNLSLPLGVSFIVFLLAVNPPLWPFFLCLGITLLILIIAYYLRAITFSAFPAAALLGVCLFALGGFISFFALITFFVLGSAVSRIGKHKKLSAAALHERQGARSVAQVAANGLPSLIFAVLFRTTGIESFLLAVLVCFAAATSDTFSSEIGMLSSSVPVSILTLKPVRRGISGGVTLLGFSGGLLGALMVSVLAIPKFKICGMLAVFAAGLAGTLIDSLLGSLFQAKYHQGSGESAGDITEIKSLGGTPLKLAQGITWVNNDMVNFLSTLICGLLAAILWP